MSHVVKFLQQYNLSSNEPDFPFVHTTRSYYIRDFITENKILPSPCDTFIGRDLSYFFVGRPSYKYPLSSDSEYWELPVCLIMSFGSVNPIEIYPFDTGGFNRGLMPDYIKFMKRDNFSLGPDKHLIKSLIGVFFANNKSYFDYRGRGSDSFKNKFSPSHLDAEINALHKLAIRKSNMSFDDRNFSIEAQSEKIVDIKPDNILAIVLPTVYLDDNNLVKHIENTWKSEILSYDLYPINGEAYYFAIYDQVKLFLQQRSII